MNDEWDNKRAETIARHDLADAEQQSETDRPHALRVQARDLQVKAWKRISTIFDIVNMVCLDLEGGELNELETFLDDVQIRANRFIEQQGIDDR